jgi:hypothetical protein
MGYKLAQTSKAMPLKERIAELRAEIDAWIDAKAAEIAKDNPGVPQVAIRYDLTARGGSCQCRNYLINTGELK